LLLNQQIDPRTRHCRLREGVTFEYLDGVSWQSTRAAEASARLSSGRMTSPMRRSRAISRAVRTSTTRRPRRQTYRLWLRAPRSGRSRIVTA
jgi:hypothetical protein